MPCGPDTPRPPVGREARPAPSPHTSHYKSYDTVGSAYDAPCARHIFGPRRRGGERLSAIVLTLLTIAWALLVARAVAFRATVTWRTVLCYMATGMIAGPTAIFLLHRLVNPYAQGNFPYTPVLTWTLSLVTVGLLLSPVLFRLVRRRVHVMLSVGDAFLLGFALGLGLDVFGVLLAVGQGFDVWQSLTWLPPWQQQVAPETWLTGTAYRTGWLAAVLVAAQRFIGSRPASWALAALAALFITVESVAWAWPLPSDEVSLWSVVRGAVAFVTFGGVLTPWIVWVSTVGLQILEARWAGDDPETLVQEWRALAEDLRRLAPRAALARHTAACRARQLRIAEAELRAAPDDSVIATVVARLRALPAASDDTGDASDSDPSGAAATAATRGDAGTERPGERGAVRLPSIVVPGWALALVPWLLLYALLTLPGAIERAFVWLGIAAVVWWYVTAPGRIGGFRSGDDVASYYAEHYLLLGALTLSILVAFSLLSTPLFPTTAASLVLPFRGAPFSLELAMLALAGAASSLTWGRRMRWSAQPLRERRIHALRRGLGVASVVLVTWLGVRIYLWAIPLIHQKWGVYVAYIASVPAAQPRPEEMWWWARALHFEIPEPFGNNLPAWAMAIALGPAAGALLLALHRLSSVLLRVVTARAGAPAERT